MLKIGTILMVLTTSVYTLDSSEANVMAKRWYPYASMGVCGDDSVLRAWSKEGIRKDTPPTKVITTIYDAKLDLRGYIADVKDEGLVMSFRGVASELNKEYTEKIEFKYHSFYNPCTKKTTKVNIHEGFMQQLEQLKLHYHHILSRKDVHSILTKKGISLVSHSMGGAISGLVALDIANTFNLKKDKVRLITYGQPKVGDIKFAEYAKKTIGTKLRVTHGTDDIPNLPPKFIGYWHYPQELHLPNNGNVGRLCSPKNGEDRCYIDSPSAENFHETYFGINIDPGCNKQAKPKPSMMKQVQIKCLRS